MLKKRCSVAPISGEHRVIRQSVPEPFTIGLRRQSFGGYFQWVLDAACETVEWPCQPLGFDSVALRRYSTPRFDLILKYRCIIIVVSFAGGVLVNGYPIGKGSGLIPGAFVFPTILSLRLTGMVKPRIMGKAEVDDISRK